MLVSIIITNYNYGKYLHRCIRSCLNQKLNANEFEVILVDDFSNKDNIDHIVNEYKSLPNFRLIKNKKNLGVAESSNNAIKKANGKYVVRVDSDDYVTNEFANILSYYLNEHPEKLGIACDYFLVDDFGKKISRVSSKKKPISCGIMYNKKKLIKAGLYNKKFKHREEEELRARLGEVYKIHHINLPLYRYRMHNTNKTKSDDYVNKFRLRINKIKKYKFLNKYKNHKLLKNILIIIPARGGSKRLKNKNLYIFKDKPMIYWAINAAKKTIFKNNLYVSSENKKIIETSKKFGTKTINRPIYLSKDNTFKIDVIRHAVETIEKKTKKKASLVISLQANSPEIQSTDIDEIIIHLIKFKLQEVISVDKNNNSNAAVRLMLRKAVFQKSLSTYLGCVYTDTTDIHTLKDIQKIYKKNENK